MWDTAVSDSGVKETLYHQTYVKRVVFTVMPIGIYSNYKEEGGEQNFHNQDVD